MRKDSIDQLQAAWGSERPDLDPSSLGVVLRVQSLARRLDEQASRALERVDLEWWEYDVLSTLRRQGEPFAMASTELARASHLSTGAMTHRVDRLVARELVVREPDLGDRRRVIVRLDAAGLILVDRATAARFGAADAALAGLTAADQETLGRLLRKLSLSMDG